MYIKSITIDGFKTYGKRTEINGLDQSFNAITGLNGSGKSNLLDSICFVLGLTNPSIARVAHLRELIYKNGQTGLTKASVSITFNNSNKRQSPAGYENYDEITIRREVTMENRTRYFINGFTASNQQVSDLFQSVSLNISNPHFLIMQGRITKVLNMKPNEILSMVEEATGLSLYESKKKTTQSTLVKKDLALNSIDILIHETILTKLEQLTKEQSSLLAYQRVCIDLENLKKIHTAWTYTNLSNLSQQTDARIKDQQNMITEAEEKIESINDSVEQIQEQIRQSQKDSVFRPRLAALEDQLKEVQMEETKAQSEMNLKKDNLNEVLKMKSNLVKQIKDESKVKSTKEKEFEKLNQAFSQFEETRKQDEITLEKASKDLEVIASGASRGDDGEAAATLADQLMQTKREIANLDTETAKAKMKVQHCKAELVKKESEASKKKGSYENDLKLVERMESEVSKLKNGLESTGFDEASSESMLTERESLRKDYDQLRYDVNSLENKLPQIHFNYRKPTADFDSGRVKGAVCTLFKVKDPRNYTALEVAAGGRLYNIIVSDEETAKLILEKGRPEKRCTLLPLDKIRGRDVDSRALKNAQNIVGRDNVFPALDLIEFDPSLNEAMKYVFGDTLICPNMECAKKATFAKNVQLRTVTLDGEVFDPSGTLTGGAIGGKGAVLSAVDQLMKKRSAFGKIKARLMEIERQLDSMHSSRQQFTQLKQQYDLRCHEIELLRERLKTTNQHLLLEEIENLKATIEENETSLQDMVDRKKTADKKVKELENKMKNTASIRERELAEAEKALETAKKNFEKSKKAASEREQSVSFLKIEIDELKKSLDNYTSQLAEVDAKIEAHQAEVDEANASVESAKEKVSGVQEEMKKLKRLMNEHSSEIAKLNKQKENLIREADEMKLSIKKYQHEISQIQNEGKDAGKGIQVLVKKFPWINEEKHLFGEESAGYGFKRSDFNPVELDDRIKRLSDEKNKLSKTVNMRANVMLGDKEKEAEELNKKRQIIENDKKKLLGYMEDVDKKKKDALQDAWEKINIDFGNIFSTLLPGANAQLMPPEGKTIMDGLEVKVAFGDVWKESLTELSGGQRSLVALSLILALLLYNPAPIYILDEVDAALDQSHTTNIGTMIKKHFTNSQFIIVSLKDDMFNNANVLFRTKFIDGCSTVTRFAKGDR